MARVVVASRVLLGTVFLVFGANYFLPFIAFPAPSDRVADLSKARPEDVRPSGELRIHVGRDLDGLFEAYRAHGVELVFAPVSQPWGLREFAVRERDGHVLRFCGEV